MLHLACHGGYEADERIARSFLMLASDDPAKRDSDELHAYQLVEVMRQAPDRQVGLVVLAACRTGRAIHGYDEAYSLGTAFLAGGVRSVLSTQWGIPDTATSSLMFMFHHYLRQARMTPGQALRQAQLWMLDPQRRRPAEMPSALYSPASAADHAQVVAWAGFVHWGQ
jgi:CHAT domain-containing protein